MKQEGLGGVGGEVDGERHGVGGRGRTEMEGDAGA